jgi:signal transduction histidine kinase/CheY-like chemotaxis protein
MVPGLIASALVILLLKLNAWAALERSLTDQLMRFGNGGTWDSRIVMISIDDKTLSQLGQFPISREHYANLLWMLTHEDTSVVVFNLLLSDQVAAGGDLTASSRANAQMAGAMATHGRVVLGQIWGQDDQEIKPVPVLAETAITLGHLRLPVDPDGVTRHVEITWQGVPALGVAAIQAYGLEKEIIPIPTDLSALQINWPGPAADLTTLSLIDVLEGRFPSGFLKEKIVIVGYGATTGRAQLRTPFDNRAPIPGGYMHAAVIDNLLNQNWLRSVPEDTGALVLLIAGPLLAGVLYRRETLMQLAMGGALVLSWLLICMGAMQLGYLLPVVTPLVAIVMTGAIVFALSRLQAHALLQVRSDFLNTISHEIRTPLNAIVNLSEMLQETRLDERQREFAETLQNSSQTLLALINDVLDFSKIESGQLMLEAYPVSLSAIVERSLDMLAPHAAEKGLELTYSLTPTTPAVVMSDPVRLQQILLNLLSNAVKFTERGEVSVQVQATAIAYKKRDRPHLLASAQQSIPSPPSAKFSRQPLGKPRHQPPEPLQALYEIRFAITDTGIGIPPEQISQLFKPFGQVSASTTRKYGGTGLGLAISKRLSERMGGDLWVRSYPNRGSTFYFTVQAEAAESLPAPPGYLSGLRGTRLILIDRYRTRRDRLFWELQSLGVNLAQASSLAEALLLLQEGAAADGMIVDEAVITNNNKEADALHRGIATLRQAAHNEHLPIIVLSAINRISLQLPDDTITLWKPVKQAALYQALRSIHPAAMISPPALAIAPADQLQSAARPEAKPNLAASMQSDMQSDLPGSPELQSRLRILIAEDNQVNQRVALRLLELLGYTADIVSSGREALAALERQSYHVILMDMRMPELDGIEATRQIRQMPQHQNVWIIAMTANAMAKDRQRCFEAGMNDYLSKPIKREALAQALARCLGNGLSA